MDADVKRAIQELAANIQPPPMGESGLTVLGQIQVPTVTIDQNHRFWPFRIALGQGPEVEGAACSYTMPAGTATLYAVNLGSKNPAYGDIVIVHNIDGYWFFAFHGVIPAT